jgi:hypothetical protein
MVRCLRDGEMVLTPLRFGRSLRYAACDRDARLFRWRPPQPCDAGFVWPASVGRCRRAFLASLWTLVFPRLSRMGETSGRQVQISDHAEYPFNNHNIAEI